MTVDSDPNVGIAMALTCGAGAATALGAAVVFVPSLVRLASKRVLAGGLGLSAGVMTYVSFVEIFPASHTSFGKAGFDDGTAYALATGCFFGGVLFMVILNAIVTWLLKGLGGHGHSHDYPVEDGKAYTHQRTVSVSRDGDEADAEASGDSSERGADNGTDGAAPIGCPCCSADPAGDFDQLQKMAEQMDEYQRTHEHHDWEPHAQADGDDGHHHEKSTVCCDGAHGSETRTPEEPEGDVPEPAKERTADEESDQDDERPVARPAHDHDHHHHHGDEALLKMSINTALAIALHNFPEGMATFVASLSNPKVGVVLAVAIAIHNIPEGLCVALPIYYATGRKWRAFWWACLSGLSEPLAALLGWAALANSFTDAMFGSLFGVVGGMMVIISARELLPTAHRYDPEDSVVTYSFMFGMFIMALSLTMFVL